VNLLTSLKNFFFPPFCLVCFCPGVILCERCFAKLPQYNNSTVNHFSWFCYDHLSSRLLKKAKYRGYQSVFEELLTSIPLRRRLALGDFLKRNQCDGVCFVPLSSSDYQIRGYNQAERLASFLSINYNLALYSVIKKIRSNRRQSMLKDIRARQTNVRGVYQVTNHKLVAGKTLVLVDDVITTGSTIDEVTEILLQAGAQRVVQFSVFCARSLKRQLDFSTNL